MISLKINNVTVLNRIARNSISYSFDKNKKRSLSINVEWTASEVFPTEGQDIQLYDSGVLKFGGTISTVSKNPFTPQTGTNAKINLSIKSNGYNSIPRRRTIIPAYESTTAGAVVQDLITRFLSTEGVTAGSISTGGTIVSYPQDAVSIINILDDMAELSGYEWNINSDKSLDFLPPTGLNMTSVEIKEGERDHFEFSYEESLSEYANKVFVIGNGVMSTVEDTAEITNRQAIEGGSGVYGFVFKDNNIQAQADADATAIELLNRKKVTGSASFNCYTELLVGSTIKVTYPKYGILADTYFHILKMSAKRQDDIWIYSYYIEERNISSFSGKLKDDGADYFRQLKKAASTATKPESIIAITSATNDAQQISGDVVLTGIDASVTDKSAIAFMVNIGAEATGTVSGTIYIRINGTNQHSTPFRVEDKETISFTGTLDKQTAGTYNIDIRVVCDSGAITIPVNAYNLTLFVRGGQTAEGAAYPQANVNELWTLKNTITYLLSGWTDSVSATTTTSATNSITESWSISTTISTLLIGWTDTAETEVI